MAQWLLGLSLCDGILQRSDHRLCVQAFMHVMAHYFSRVSVGYQTQIGHAFLGGQVSYIRNPYLFRPVGDDLFRACLEQIGMASKAMMAMGRFVISPLARNQFARFSQDRKQAVSPYLQRCFCFAMQ